MRSVFVQINCDAPNCDEKLVLPMRQQGPVIASREQQEELDRWIAVHRNDGSQFDYYRQQCALNGLNTLAPVERVEREEQPSGLILP